MYYYLAKSGDDSPLFKIELLSNKYNIKAKLNNINGVKKNFIELNIFNSIIENFNRIKYF